MKTNDILQEKYRIQKQLAEAARDVHDYFAKTHKSARRIMNSIDVTNKKPEHSDRTSAK